MSDDLMNLIARGNPAISFFFVIEPCLLGLAIHLQQCCLGVVVRHVAVNDIMPLAFCFTDMIQTKWSFKGLSLPLLPPAALYHRVGGSRVCLYAQSGSSLLALLVRIQNGQSYAYGSSHSSSSL